MKYLTSSIYDFEELINGGYLYIDKTEYVWKMIQNTRGYYFLSRPRRFGKSLLVSTLKAVFAGKRELFKGLALYDKPYDWKQYPVIHLDLGSCQSDTVEILEKRLQTKILHAADRLGITVSGDDSTAQFENLIFDAAKIAPPVVLIDEYDKPILGNISDKENVSDILRKLKSFYSVIKTSSPLLRFVFLTGVSKFCHVSVFSDLNNLNDISMDADFATMLGYTQAEFENKFAEYIAQEESKQDLPHEQYMDKIKRWYDGFHFEENADTVYNPVSLANFFIKGGKFNNYWFSTGTPSFLIELIKQQHFNFEKILTQPVTSVAFSAYEVDNPDVLQLLLQTGYLTIHHTRQFGEQTLYYLDFPNVEVKTAFDTYLINAYTNLTRGDIELKIVMLEEYVRQGDVDNFMQCLQSMLAEIPYSIQLQDEKYYQTIFYLVFLLLGVHIIAEAQTNNGRIDAVASAGNLVYIFEFKLNKDEEVAFDQIMTRQYYKKFQYSGKKIVLVGANFDFDRRQIADWKTKEL
jgi:hypothetical protein